jgi:hypothetical protein
MRLEERKGEGPRPRSALGAALVWSKEFPDASRDRGAPSLKGSAASFGFTPFFQVSGIFAVV